MGSVSTSIKIYTGDSNMPVGKIHHYRGVPEMFPSWLHRWHESREREREREEKDYTEN
jgi:hypothetical protein